MDAETEHILSIARTHFPHPTPNPGQLETIVEVVKSFKAGKRHVVVQAPTGIGKSDIATTVHLVMQEINSPNRFRTTITTATKALQDQYTDGVIPIFDLRGRTNYDCPIDMGPYNSGTCRGARARKQCTKATPCPYLLTRSRWLRVEDLRVTNSSFQIDAPHMLVCQDETRPDLIIIDECHEIDDDILEHTKIAISRYDMRGIFDLEDFSQRVVDKFSMISLGVPIVITEGMLTAMAEYREQVHAAIELYEQDMENKKGDLDSVGAKLDALHTAQRSLDLFSDNPNDMWLVESVTESTVVVKPIKASQVSNFALFSKAKMFLHMSATICGFEEYAVSLGIKPDEVDYLDVPNPIPVQSRLVYAPGFMKVSGNIDYDQLTRHIDNLIEMHPDENGLVHTVSYTLANEVYKRSRFRERMFMTKDRAEMVSELRTRKNVVVLSPAIEKGFDAKGDMARFQIVAKVPFPYLGDSLIKYNAANTPGWYPRKTVLRVVQACGRVTRGPTDFGVTYILDSNFSRLYYDNPGLFPEWFKQSVRM